MADLTNLSDDELVEQTRELLGGGKADDRERQLFARIREAKKSARCCGNCGEAIGLRKSVWIGLVAHPAFHLIYTHSLVPLCEGCSRRQRRRFHLNPFPCVTCGRNVYLREPPNQYFIRHAIACSDDCRAAYYRAKRLARKGPRERVCATCGETFTPPRRDAKTCSPACRQKAYRQRVTEAVYSEENKPHP
jgi:hypothetical protein